MKTVFHLSQLRCLSNVYILGIEGLLPLEQVGKSGLAAAAERNDFITILTNNILFHNGMGIFGIFDVQLMLQGGLRLKQNITYPEIFNAHESNIRL